MIADTPPVAIVRHHLGHGIGTPVVRIARRVTGEASTRVAVVVYPAADYSPQTHCVTLAVDFGGGYILHCEASA